MSLSYEWRLLFLSSAVFFLVNLAVGLAVRAGSSFAVGLAGRMAPNRAAGFLLMLRLLAPGLAFAAVLALCVPSYVRFEPLSGTEHVGDICLAAAGLGLAVCGLAAIRALRAAVRTRRFVRGTMPCVALAGVIRPRLLVSPAVQRALTPDELQAALDHERAHGQSRDNLKRLVLTLAPGVLPFYSAFGPIERNWARFTEWAADDCAARGDRMRSMSLAAALVRVARLQRGIAAAPLATSLLGDSPDLSVRVQRLLNADPLPASVAEPARRIRLGFWVAVAAGAMAAMWNPAALATAHRLLEHLME